MDNEKDLAKKMLLKFMEMSLKHSKINVPQPLPLIEKKAEERLSNDGLIAFKLIIKEFKKAPIEDQKTISRLLLIASHDLIETMNSPKDLLEDHKDTGDFVSQHPEYGKSDEEIAGDSIVDEFEDLFE